MRLTGTATLLLFFTCGVSSCTRDGTDKIRGGIRAKHVATQLNVALRAYVDVNGRLPDSSGGQNHALSLLEPFLEVPADETVSAVDFNRLRESAYVAGIRLLESDVPVSLSSDRQLVCWVMPLDQAHAIAMTLGGDAVTVSGASARTDMNDGTSMSSSILGSYWDSPANSFVINKELFGQWQVFPESSVVRIDADTSETALHYSNGGRIVLAKEGDAVRRRTIFWPDGRMSAQTIETDHAGMIVEIVDDGAVGG